MKTEELVEIIVGNLEELDNYDTESYMTISDTLAVRATDGLLGITFSGMSNSTMFIVRDKQTHPALMGLLLYVNSQIITKIMQEKLTRKDELLIDAEEENDRLNDELINLAESNDYPTDSVEDVGCECCEKIPDIQICYESADGRSGGAEWIRGDVEKVMIKGDIQTLDYKFRNNG